jgi:hypothetical protein
MSMTSNSEMIAMVNRAIELVPTLMPETDRPQGKLFLVGVSRTATGILVALLALATAMQEKTLKGQVMNKSEKPIAYLYTLGGERGYRAVCLDCAKDNDPNKSSPLYPINIRPYTQHCCLCEKVIVKGASKRDLFDGT